MKKLIALSTLLLLLIGCNNKPTTEAPSVNYNSSVPYTVQPQIRATQKMDSVALIEQFKIIRTQALVYAKENEGISKPLTFISPVFGSYSNNQIKLSGLRQISNLLFVIMPDDEFFAFCRLSRPDIQTNADRRLIRMVFYRQPVNLSGHDVYIIAAPAAFATDGLKRSALALLHETQHAIQQKKYAGTMDQTSREIEAYTKQEESFIGSLTVKQKNRWYELRDKVRMLPNPSVIVSDTVYVGTCHYEFGDPALVDMLLISALTPKGFVEKYYLQK